MNAKTSKPRAVVGFSLVEQMIVVVIIRIIAAIAVPDLLSARKRTNEASAFHWLLFISSSQARFPFPAFPIF